MSSTSTFCATILWTLLVLQELNNNMRKIKLLTLVDPICVKVNYWFVVGYVWQVVVGPSLLLMNIFWAFVSPFRFGCLGNLQWKKGGILLKLNVDAFGNAKNADTKTVNKFIKANILEKRK